ncbi:MAG TPA: CDP-diacylglycerol--serine O-phosphatidyltransferase [Luteolibacter sp.]|nr:CDP-diacylglycerol--serine O-phosphatidyltransferase [Luteolibacter sp.]
MPKYRDPDEPKIYFLPNLMTAGNLACGFFAVLMIFFGMIEVQRVIEIKKAAGDLTNYLMAGSEYFQISKKYYEYAILLIFGSCLFDLLDGRLARLGGQDSPFGREFDSLADIVSFGMAPAMLVSKAVLFALPSNIGWVLAFVYLLCGAMRLARFNCLAALPKKPNASNDFRGIPIPMAAGFIASLTFLIIDIYRTDRDLGFWKYALAAAMLGLSALMISDVRYPSFKKVDLKTRSTLWAIVLAAVLIVITVKYLYIVPVVLFSVYLLYGLIRPWISQRWRKGIEVEEDSEAEEIPTTINTSENLREESPETTR